MMLTKEQVVEWLRLCAAVLEQKRNYLTELDAAIGDADHGINMERGFKKVASQLPGAANADIGTILKSAGMALISSVGGASGPLYGTFFLRAAIIAAGKQELSASEVANMLEAGMNGIEERGKARPGEKTMLDALAPAIEALKSGGGILQALNNAVAAAEKGMQGTIPMLAKKGRASYLGERSVGHQDPGATSTYLIIKALRDAAGVG
jgi:phosphoenolpyruvate---glycerone phosphotransferase subunit DhaL